MSKTRKTSAVSTEDLKAQLAAQNQARMQACARDIDAALKKHGCILTASISAQHDPGSGLMKYAAIPQISLIPEGT